MVLEEVVEVQMPEQTWVFELHVDFLDVRERQSMCPFWGGAISRRCNLARELCEECGQDEKSFHQIASRQDYWHKGNEVKLCHDLKRAGAGCHVMA